MSEKNKFDPGDLVSYLCQASVKRVLPFEEKVGVMEDMKGTRIVSFNDIALNPNNEGRLENRYVIEHFHGWWPAHQRGGDTLNPDIEFAEYSDDKRYMYSALKREKGKIYLDRKCCFAFESELNPIRAQYKI